MQEMQFKCVGLKLEPIIFVVVFGWLQDSFIGMEQGPAHMVHVGYLKGGQLAGVEIILNVMSQLDNASKPHVQKLYDPLSHVVMITFPRIHKPVGSTLDCMRGCKPYKDLTLLDTMIALSGSKANRCNWVDFFTLLSAT